MPVLVGVDVGSTTVKAVAVDATTQGVVWQDYQRHEARQPEKVLEFLQRLETEAGLSVGTDRVFLTGSGGSNLAPLLGAKFVQAATRRPDHRLQAEHTVLRRQWVLPSSHRREISHALDITDVWKK